MLSHPMRVAAGAMLSILVTVSGAASRSMTVLDLELDGPVDRQTIAYDCRASETAEPTRMMVEYVNLPYNNLAILPIDGHQTVFVTTISGSGAKYVSGAMVWWTKGNRGDLYSEMRQDASETTVCKVVRG